MIWGMLRSLFTTPQRPFIEVPSPLSKWTEDSSSNYKKLSELKIVTFNMLAPCYKRLPTPDLPHQNDIPILRRASIRESSKDFVWKDRARRCIDFFDAELVTADIIALQEFWLEEEYASLFYAAMRCKGYQCQTLQRSGSKSDAVAILIKSDLFKVMKQKNIELSRFGDRVALLLWLRYQQAGETHDIIIANTHLSFPHNDFDRANQMEQMKTLTEAIDDFVAVNALYRSTRLILGDFNVVSSSAVCWHLRKSGYSSCLEVSAPAEEGVTVDTFISHRTHRREDLGVDHIFVRNDHAGDAVKEAVEVFIAGTEVIPKALGCSVWNESFTISDHRPVCSTLVFSSKK